MELTELIRTRQSNPERTWNIASSEHWYNGDDFWLQMIDNDPIYKGAMIDTEAQLIDSLCGNVAGSQQTGIFVALGPGDSKKEAKIHAALGTPTYVPISINESELALTRNVPGKVRPVLAEFREGLRCVRDESPKFIYLGSTYSNLAAIHYDLLAAIDECMKSGDSAYVSVQTVPRIADLPLLMHQYSNAQYLKLNKRMANMIGAEVNGTFVQFNPITRNVEIGSIISTVTGTAKEVGMRAGDKIVSLVSHKPESLMPELTARYGTRYTMSAYQEQREVPTPSGTYRSTFEGAIMTKK